MVLVQRNPTLSSRFDGVMLLRFAARMPCGLKYHDPPRNTRDEPVGPTGSLTLDEG